MKPERFVPRTKLRLFLGKSFYSLKRYCRWYFGGIKYATKHSIDELPFLASTHCTPLLRKLSGVDMILQYNKVENLKIAAKRLNGLVLKPGEIFSYWKTIGKPTFRKGYKAGMVLVNGGFKPGIGGGLCQMSNLIYWMTLHTDLTVTERYRHSHDVFPDSNRTQPFGSGATCVYNYIDLQIKNQTDKTFQLSIRLNDEHLIGEWRSDGENDKDYEVYELKHWITHEYWGDYIRHNVICRRIFDQKGMLVEDEYITENHAIMMYTPFLQPACETAKE